MGISAYQNMTPSRQATSRRRVSGLFRSRLLRAAISALLLLILITRLNLSELASTLSQVIPGLLLLGILFFVLASVMSVFKWQGVSGIILLMTVGRSAWLQ